ncbi:MAG: hypothetical protein NC311_15140 [Muribaculaceae bacterium]|nr:hypothetical protein [Muribaculaceae bacterium]MCM1400354.1 hypothetical protein [Clostridium sp.]MCM1461049.1 hypothetical protein [Bacteroides sp.]
MLNVIYLIITIVVAIAAILSPILTAIINNRYQLKLKKMDLQQELNKQTVIYKRSIFEDYLKFAGKCVAHGNSETVKQYGEHYLLASLHSTPALREKLYKVHLLIKELNYQEAANVLNSIVPDIEESIGRL